MTTLRSLWLIYAITFAIMSMPLFSYAQQQEEENELHEMKRQIGILTEEIEKLKLGAVAEPEYESFMGLGPAASKVYAVEKGLSIGGYGEVVYANYQESSKKDLMDTQRFVLYGGYKYSDRVIMNTELEFEHGGKSDVYVEFSYLDFLLDPLFNLRTGLVLVPIGIVNKYHEPTVYHGVFRPDVETNIIPTTWREIGLIVFGGKGSLSYEAGVLNGMKLDGFDNKGWIRGGRYKGIKANGDNLALVANLEYELLTGFNMGGAYYLGETGQGDGGDEVKAGEKEGTINILEVHVVYSYRSLDLKGLFTRGVLDGNSALESSPPGEAGKEVQGWYIEAAYDMMYLIRPGSVMALSPFIRYEEYDTHKEVFTGVRDTGFSRTVTTAGLDFKPHSNVVIKADYQWRDTESGLPAGKGTGLDENKIDQLNIGVGFIF